MQTNTNRKTERGTIISHFSELRCRAEAVQELKGKSPSSKQL